MSISIIDAALDPVELPVKNLRAIQTTRLSPFPQTQSKQPFDSFNVGLHVGDNLQDVQENRQSLLTLLPEHAQIQWLEQVHGNDVALIDHVSLLPLTADAQITRTPNVALAIMTADCLPILLTNKQGTEIAAIHGGWRPLANNIIANTKALMRSESEQLIAWLGPCIGPEAFEVGSEVRDTFLQLSNELNKAFTPLSSGKWLANLVTIASHLLAEQGITEVNNGHRCTFTHHQRYYSFRRDQVTGRMVSLICIAP